MAVSRKATKPKHSQLDVEDIINRGGKTIAESTTAVIDESEDELRFTLRIPKKLISKIDKKRKNEIGKVSRNQWILEVIAERLGE